MANYLYDGVFGSFASDPKTFLRTPSGQISFAEFTTLTNRLANCLTGAGVKPGDRVAVQAEKSVTQLALYAATVKAGGVYLPLNTGYTAHELDYFLSDAKPALIVVDAATQVSIAASVASLKAVLMTLNQDETGTLQEQALKSSEQFNTVARGSEDLAAILYTSGTTGRSKGAQICHRNLVSNAQVLADTWQFTSNDTLLHMLPIYHTHGLFVACNLLAMVGGSMIFLPKFSVETALTWMPQATTMMGVPTFYTRLLDDKEFTSAATEHMRLFISGSAPLPAETHNLFEARTGKLILERYGMTETNMSTSNPFEGARLAGTVGRPLPGVDLRIVDAQTGQPVATGEIGIIELKGDNIFLGYWEMAEMTAESFREDGYFITGDMAQQDDNGYVTIVGRDKDLIISGGLNIYPKEVEALIDELDGVLESAVIGTAHKDFGEAVVAIIVKKDELITEETIADFLKDKTAKFKQPKAIFFASSLPRNTMGKVQKSELRKTYANLFTP
jgi:malonyl-CoA/methylmalonyl-CoA synthetase